MAASPRLKAAGLGIALGLLAVLGGSQPAQGADPPEAGNDRFGLCFVSSAEYPADEARYQRGLSTGATWTRWPFYWRDIEKAPGTFDYSAHDPVVAADIAHGFRVDAILLGTPDFYATGGSPQVPAPRVEQKNLPCQIASFSWEVGVSSASTAPQNLHQPVFDDGTDIPGPDKNINPDNHWARFVADIVARYKPGGWLATQEGWPEGAGISHWEVWNEPDFAFFWSGTVEEYYRLLKVAYLAAKFADPDCTVIVGGLANYFDPYWFPRLLDAIEEDPDRAANNWYFDAVAVHMYSRPWDTYWHTWRIGYYLRLHGLDDKPIWVNESGVPVWDDYPGPTWEPDSPYRATMEEQAAYVIQNYVYGLYAGAERIFFFMLHDDCGNGPDAHDAYGLFRNTADAPCYPSDGRARPSYTAYRVAATHLRDVEPLWRRMPEGQQEQIAFYRPTTRERVMVLWATQGVTVTTQVSATGSAGLLIDQAGITRTISPTNGVYTVTLPAATNQNLPGSDEYMIGGRPYILIETDTLTPTAQVEPLPPYSSRVFTVRWRGGDDGSGIASYDVFYNVDGGPLTAWLTETVATSAPFTGTVGSTYGFAARARDRAGNVGPEPSEPQAQTTVVEGALAGGKVTDNTARPVAGAQVTLISGTGITYTVVTDEGGLWRTERLPLTTYTVTASAPGYGQWPAPRQLALSGPDVLDFDLNLPPVTNLVRNGDFEAGLEGWTPGGSTAPQIGGEPFDGQNALVLGKDFVGQEELGGGGNSTVHQTITVPITVTSPHLSFVYRLVTEETAQGSDWFEVILIEGDQTTYLIQSGEEWQNTEGWRQLSFDLSSWRGHTFDLYFNVWQSSPDSPTLAYVDEVSVGPARWRYSLFFPIVAKGQ